MASYVCEDTRRLRHLWVGGSAVGVFSRERSVASRVEIWRLHVSVSERRSA